MCRRGEEMKRLLKRLDDFAFRNPGAMLVFNVSCIMIAIVCTLINVLR